MFLTVVYHIFNFGWLVAISYYVFGVFLCILIITFPLGISMFTIGEWHFTPFSKRLIKKSKLNRMTQKEQNKWYAPLIPIANVIWAIFFGWWLVTLQAVGAVISCLTIIGIPMGIAQFRMLGTLFAPFGVTIISEDEYRALILKNSQHLNQTPPNQTTI